MYNLYDSDTFQPIHCVLFLCTQPIHTEYNLYSTRAAVQKLYWAEYKKIAAQGLSTRANTKMYPPATAMYCWWPDVVPTAERTLENVDDVDIQE